ncbi:LOW QUALITY PROTEIN: uncharacterized protein [Blastocystis hominis]|uniref:RRM domain-containing protein n=1 Tax=Blastocystis hominis TaxID=12968 RepID=D8LVY2_BLAHO|nr:LOW QUALITY PROTEIN: uncharacterized protein [Blastocystis hominis]CBK19971.2 unnamed protein product [Blastocystis hominis]|eukprot:XP_012894019.1 LOW QUALITY PROTEIN: uncharacterized protein [Blastocystis hominis]
MDATDSLFRMYEPSFHSNTPLLHPNSFFDSRTYSGDDFCSSQWSSDFSAFRNPSVLPAVSTSSIPTRPFEFSDPRGAEVWSQPLNRWDSQERSLRPSIRTGSLFQDLPAERRRSNSMSVMHSSSSLFFQNTYSPTPLSFGYLTPAQNALPLSETDALDDFSLGDVAPFDASFATTEPQPVAERSLNEGLHLAKLPSEEPIHTGSALNPNSAEFIPGGKKTGKQGNRGGAEHGKAGVKPRDLLEQTMLQQRIVENRITTLKLRGLPYTATKEEIAAFFAPLEVPRDAKGELTIVIGQDNLQRPSGEAFVTFSSVEDSAKGLEYHLKNLGKRYIEIFPLFNKDYYRRSEWRGRRAKYMIYCSICNKYGHTKESCVLRTHS